MDSLTCECGQHLKTYVVTLDEEQYVENLCPVCAFPNPASPADPGDYNFADTDSNRTLTLEMIDTTMAQLRSQGRTGKVLMTSPGTLNKLSEEFEAHTRVVAPPSMTKKLVSAGRVLDVQTTKELNDNESLIIDTDNSVHPVTGGESPTSAAFRMAVLNAYSINLQPGDTIAIEWTLKK